MYIKKRIFSAYIYKNICIYIKHTNVKTSTMPWMMNVLYKDQ